MKPDLSSFEKALLNLKKAINRANDSAEDLELRDAVIQRFEYTYELSWKMLKRILEKESPTPAEIDRLSFTELLREALERSLIKDFEKWLEYRNQRNITSHTYNEKKAESVYKTALQFSNDAANLFNEIKQRNHD